MIEVNLLPGGKKRSSRGRGFSFSMPKLGGGGGGGLSLPGDPYVLGAIGAGVVSLAIMGWMYMGITGDMEETQVSVDAAVSDSVRFADIILRTDQLIARRDSIAQRVAIIQDIDAGRFVWPHILDEIAIAMPDYIWIREIIQTSGGIPLELRLSGQAGDNTAITRFMRNLEASRFMRGVHLEGTSQAPAEGGGGDRVYEFDLVLTFDPPPLEELNTVPLFGNDLAQSAVPDSTEG